MSQEDRIRFGKKISEMNNNYEEKKDVIEPKIDNYDILVKKLSKKYNISEKEAKNVIKHIEQGNIYSSQNDCFQSKDQTSQETSSNTKFQPTTKNIPPISKIKRHSNVDSQLNQNLKVESDSEENRINRYNKKQERDNIEDIVSVDNNPNAYLKLEHDDSTSEFTNEKVHALKKFGIRFIKRQKSTKNKENDGLEESKIDNYNISDKKLPNQHDISEEKKVIEQKDIYSSQSDSFQSKNQTSQEINSNKGFQPTKNIPPISKIKRSSNVDSQSNQNLKEESSLKENKIDKSSEQDVDNIISEIIPNYNQNISIELEHVDLTFEVTNDKVDTIKELCIRSLKRQKSTKLSIHALKDISFKIYKGEKVGIIGYNGAGKSTLLNVIAGIYGPDEGLVRTNGNISPLLSLGSGFDYNYSGRKNIYLNGAVLGYEKEYLESKIDEIIEFSELGEYIDIPIKNYSSGMIAKLGFSIATAVKPDILIIDEILGVGDVNFQKKSADKIRSLMDGGTTVLLVSHSIPQIRSLCDKAIWIDNGQVKKIGEVNKVCDLYIKDAEKASNDQLANIKFR